MDLAGDDGQDGVEDDAFEGRSSWLHMQRMLRSVESQWRVVNFGVHLHPPGRE